MGEEIESLYALLGVKPDEASVSDSVNKLVKDIQSKLKSSIYGGENGVITLPATIEGTYKNGKEIEKEIKDAYAAIYNKAKQMADESVSLTLNDIKDFKNQINKFSKMTAKKSGNEAIANARNNLNQTLSDYQEFVNNLKKEVSVQQKAQTKQAQKAKAQQKAKTKKSSYFDVSDEEINDAIAKENARQAKIKAWRNKQAEQLSSKLGYKTNSGIDAGKTSSYALNASEFSEYESQWARELAKTIKETYKTTVDKQWIDKEYKPKTGAKSRATSREEHLNFLSNAAFKDLADLIAKAEKGDEDVTFDQIVEAIGVMRTIYEENGKDMATIAKAVINATQSRYDDNPRRKNAGVNREEGTEKGVGKGHERTQAYQASIQQLLKKMLGEVDTIEQKEIEANKTAVKMANAYEQAKSNAKTSKATTDTKALAQEVKGEKARDNKEYMQAVRESSREGAADTAEAQKNQQLIDETINNANTGTDSEAGKNEVVKAIREIDKDKKPGKKQELPKEFAEIIYQLGQILKTAPNSNGKTQTNPLNNLNDVMCPCQDILNRIAESAKNIDVNVGNIVQELLSLGAKLPNNLPALIEGETVKDQPIEKEPITEKANYEKFHNEKLNREIEKERNTAFVTGAVDKYRSERADKQKMYEELFEKVDIADNLKNIQNSVKTALEIPGAVDVGANAEKMSNMSREQLKKIRAQRITTFGLADVDQNPTATGDLSRVQRVKATYGWGKNQTNPFKDLKLSEGIEIDTQAITEALQTALQKNMFNAQTGGWFKNLIGPPTLYLGQDSLEKSRAEADAANTIMSKIRDAAIDILQKIQNTQLDLQGMKESGQAVFREDGSLDTEASDKAAITLFANLEEQKLALKGVLADAGMVEEVVKNTGGNLTKILQQLGFAAPELANCNKIIKNINSGLDKNGKALKFQTRTAEILNYSFQLMARSIGQMIKNWIAMMNPLSLIKRAFQDFTSYDVKWQRTMNVIKYNLRRIIRPFMEWIAQQLVNIIGLVNALMKGIGKAFGKNWDLFDQSAASAEQMREELEQAANVTASFDELHDIGTESSNNPPMDLMGDIYTPQWNDIYQNIENFGKKIGDVLAGIRKFTEGWNFWTWLAVIGGALIGLKVLKWLISLFGKGKNPLQSVADGLSFLEKAVGWAILIWAFTEFVKALKEFIDVVGHMKPEEVKQAMIALAEGIGILVGAIVGLEIITAVLEKFLKFDWKSLFGLAAEVGALAYFVDVLTDFISTVGTMEQTDVDRALDTLGKSFKTLADAIIKLEVATAIIQMFLGLNWESLFGIAALVGAFALFTYAMAKFAEAIKGLTNDDVTNGLKLLGGAFLELVVAIGLLAAIASIIPITAVPVLAVFALVIAAVALLVLAMSEFVKALHDNGEDVKLFLEGIAIVLRAFGDVVVGILSTIGDFLINLLSTVGDFIIDLLRTISGTIIGIIIALLEGAANIISSTLEGIATIITSILNGIVETFRAIGDVIRDIIEGIAVAIATIVTAIADGIRNVLQPILDFVDSVIGKVTELATTIVHEIGETIRTVIQTTGEVIIGIIDSLISAIPRLLDAILKFVREIGPAVENSCDAIMRTITKLINFVVSGIEYLVNTLLIDSINGAISTITLGMFSNVFSHIEIARFVPKYEQGTNYVPNDGLAYLHQGEAVVPKKYNTPYQPDNSGMSSAIDRLAQQVARISTKVEQGIPVKGQFVQRGSDLVATVEKANNRMKNNILNNKVYAR